MRNNELYKWGQSLKLSVYQLQQKVIKYYTIVYSNNNKNHFGLLI